MQDAAMLRFQNRANASEHMRVPGGFFTSSGTPPASYAPPKSSSALRHLRLPKGSVSTMKHVCNDPPQPSKNGNSDVMAISLVDVRRRDDTNMVPMNRVGSGRWSSTLQFLATEGLNGCTAVAITSEQAGILAHIAPRTETATGDQNLRAMMQ